MKRNNSKWPFSGATAKNRNTSRLGSVIAVQNRYQFCIFRFPYPKFFAKLLVIGMDRIQHNRLLTLQNTFSGLENICFWEGIGRRSARRRRKTTTILSPGFVSPCLRTVQVQHLLLFSELTSNSVCMGNSVDLRTSSWSCQRVYSIRQSSCSRH